MPIHLISKEIFTMPRIPKTPEYAQIAKEINSLAEAQGKVLARLADVESLLRTNTPDDGTACVEAALKFATTCELRESHFILCQQRDALFSAIKEKQRSLSNTAGLLSRKVSTETKQPQMMRCQCAAG